MVIAIDHAFMEMKEVVEGYRHEKRGQALAR